MRSMPTDTERPLTTAQVAAMLGVAPETVVNYAKQGKLPGFKLPGDHWRFFRSDVDRLLGRTSDLEAS